MRQWVWARVYRLGAALQRLAVLHGFVPQQPEPSPLTDSGFTPPPIHSPDSRFRVVVNGTVAYAGPSALQAKTTFFGAPLGLKAEFWDGPDCRGRK